MKTTRPRRKNRDTQNRRRTPVKTCPKVKDEQPSPCKSHNYRANNRIAIKPEKPKKKQPPSRNSGEQFAVATKKTTQKAQGKRRTDGTCNRHMERADMAEPHPTLPMDLVNNHALLYNSILNAKPHSGHQTVS